MSALNLFVFLLFSAALTLPEPLMFIICFSSCILSHFSLLFLLLSLPVLNETTPNYYLCLVSSKTCVPSNYIHQALKDTACGASRYGLHPLITHSFYVLFSHSFSSMSPLILSLSAFSTILLYSHCNWRWTLCLKSRTLSDHSTILWRKISWNHNFFRITCETGTKEKNPKNFKIGEKLIDETNEYFWLEIFTEKKSQIPLLILSGLLSSSESNQSNILHLSDFNFV